MNENLLLFVIGFMLWTKAIYQLKFIEFSGDTFAQLVTFSKELVYFLFYGLSVIGIYAVVGTMFFRDEKDFGSLFDAFFIMLTNPLKYY